MCDFPAMKLLEGRREAGVLLRADPKNGWAVIQAIDAARHKHAEETGCDCWERAKRANPY